MDAKIILGMGFGDEGKGITVDYFAARVHESRGIVIRFSGGQQAGHTVIIDGKKHTYSTFGSGSGRGLPTFLSEYCTFYPPNALEEYEVLVEKKINPILYIHPFAKLTTYWDVAWGRLKEKINKHGSCGKGIGATMMRNEQTPHKLFVVDLKYPDILAAKLSEIGRYYEAKLKELNLNERLKGYFHLEVMREHDWFRSSIMSSFIKELILTGIHGYNILLDFQEYIFEGSQGILLDMEHGVFPNVTYAYTTSRNALKICDEIGISPLGGSISIHYVTRCYLTRHGNGWMPSTEEIKLIGAENEHNVLNEWQGHFKVSEIDYKLLQYAMDVDNGYSWGFPKHLIVTCLDQRPEFQFDYSKLSEMHSIMESWSPDSATFKGIR